MARVVVIGGGFGGLAVCRVLRRTPCEVVVVDRQNHHLFQPLLYQVATAGLGATDAAQPIRSILTRQRNVTVLMAEVTAIDLDGRALRVAGRAEPIGYDRLVIAIGLETNYFGHPEWAAHAPGLKTLEDARRIRARVLHAFERAEGADDQDERRRLLTTVVVGGGPTGVETAGALIELARFMRRDFRRIDAGTARVVVLEGGDRLLPAFDPRLSRRAAEALRRMGVEVRLNTTVRAIEPGPVVETDDERIAAANVVWAAGLRAPDLMGCLGVQTDGRGRIVVEPDGSLPRHPEAFAIGDVTRWIDADGVEVPAVAQGALQTGRHVGRIIRDELGRGPALPAVGRPSATVTGG